MLHYFKKFFLLLLVVFPCFFAEAADPALEIKDDRSCGSYTYRKHWSKVFETRDFWFISHIDDIQYNHESRETIYKKLDLEKMKGVIDKIYLLGKTFLEKEDSKKLDYVLFTLKFPNHVLNTIGFFEEYTEDSPYPYDSFNQEIHDYADKKFKELQQVEK